jgi:hypothetical protein
MEGILVDTNMIVQETVNEAEIGRETIGGIEIGTMIILKRKAGITIGIRIAITVMTEEVASTVITKRVKRVPTKKEADRIAAVETIRRTMKDIDGGAEAKMKLEDVATNGVKTKTNAEAKMKLEDMTMNLVKTKTNAEAKMKLEDVDMNMAKTKTKNDIERAANITSGIGGRRTTLANEETTIAAIKSGIVVVEASSPGCMLPVALLRHYSTSPPDKHLPPCKRQPAS